MVGLDFRVYRGAAAAALSGDPVYGTSPIDVPGMTYRYPPTVLLAFLPTVLLPWRVGYVLHTALVVVSGLGLARLTVRYVEDRGVALGRVDHALVGAFCLGSAHAMPSVVFGNVNHFVALGVAAGVVWFDRDAVRSGAALALAALPKVFPAAVGLYLVRRRARRALAAALATGVGSLLVGLVALGPTTTRRWVTVAVLGRLRPDRFAGGLDPASHLVTVRRPLSVAFPDADPALYGPVAVLLVAPVVAYLLAATDADSGSDRRLGDPVALFALLAGVLLALPSSYLYLPVLYLPVVALLYCFEGPGRGLFLAGGVLAVLPLHRNDLALALAKLPPGPAVDEALLGVLGPVLAFGSTVLYGLCLALAACVRWRYHTG